METALTSHQRERLTSMRQREDDAFRQRVPRSLALGVKARDRMPHGVPMSWMAGLFRTPPLWIDRGQGARFTDVDGNTYLDFNVCDMSAVLGYAHPRLTEAIADQAVRGVQFMMPVEAALTVCDELRLRLGLPQWQFTLSASTANTEALRIARLATGREGLLLFEGKYHGHLDDTLWTSGEGGVAPESLGLGTAPADLAVVAFNDLDAVEQVLRRGRTAAVLTEGVLTNCGTVLPEPGFLDGLRALCTSYGAVLILDETHTQFDCYGGTVAHFGVAPDMVTGGKGIAGGIPIGAYGMTDELAEVVRSHLEDDAAGVPGVAIGGTLFGNALSLACAAVVLSELMTPAEYGRIGLLGGRLADGIEAAAGRRGLPWRAHRFGARSGYCLVPDLPRNAEEAHLSLDALFADTRRVYFANRGVWDAIATSGPHLGFAHEESDVDDYLAVLDDFLDELS
ncbi:aspartate aminotransferase family protein [Acidothermaceae bacterium B102]|nr:aspartate aminotransferase family protein [Acidothermaceae bacterium B102]